MPLLSYYCTALDENGNAVLARDWESCALAYPDEAVRSVPYAYGDPAANCSSSDAHASSFSLFAGGVLPVGTIEIWNATVPEFKAERARVGSIDASPFLDALTAAVSKLRFDGGNANEPVYAEIMANVVAPVCALVDAAIDEYESERQAGDGKA